MKASGTQGIRRSNPALACKVDKNVQSSDVWDVTGVIMLHNVAEIRSIRTGLH
jgi:hypothetical protein